MTVTATCAICRIGLEVPVAFVTPYLDCFRCLRDRKPLCNAKAEQRVVGLIIGFLNSPINIKSPLHDMTLPSPVHTISSFWCLKRELCKETVILILLGISFVDETDTS